MNGAYLSNIPAHDNLFLLAPLMCLFQQFQGFHLFIGAHLNRDLMMRLRLQSYLPGS